MPWNSSIRPFEGLRSGWWRLRERMVYRLLSLAYGAAVAHNRSCTTHGRLANRVFLQLRLERQNTSEGSPGT